MDNGGEGGSISLFLASEELTASLSGLVWRSLPAALRAPSMGLSQAEMPKLSLEEDSLLPCTPQAGKAASWLLPLLARGIFR